jgi:hypothetical protein
MFWIARRAVVRLFAGRLPGLAVSRGAAALTVNCLLGACSAATLQNGVFRGNSVSFAVGPVPGSWQAVQPEVSDGSDSFAFRKADSGTTVGGTGRCGKDADDVPLEALTQHLTIGFTNRQLIKQEPFTLDGRAALRTELTAALDGVPVHLISVVIKKNSCVYDFWWIDPRSSMDSAEFDRFVSGFRAL